MDTIQLSSLDHYFAEFITRIEGEEREGLWIAAALVSAVSCRGDVCLDLSRVAEDAIVPYLPGQENHRIPPVELWRDVLSGCSTVGRPGEYAPLVLDDSCRLYLHRSWDFERRVAEEVLGRSNRLERDASSYMVALDRYFPRSVDAIDLQREAACAALSRRFSVVSGGPGTGKTTTVARILALLVETASDSPPAILLAAPTGKAAMRLMQSIRQSLDRLTLDDPVREAIPLEVSTIHRMLGVIPGRSEFRHNKNNPLPCDLLVVDEASMIDLPLMTRLLEAIRSDARVILLGDRDQLSSVESGAVLSDICHAGSISPNNGGARPAIIQLAKSYRFGDTSGIGKLSRMINAGDGPGALLLLKSGEHTDICWHPLPSGSDFSMAFARTACEWFVDFAHASSPSEALEALEHFRILTPHRDGRFGAVNLNKLVETALLPMMRAENADSLLLPVMVTGNNYDMELYNGDTGVVARTRGGVDLKAFFPVQGGGLRSISAIRLPPHESAFALTVHKSQGSEFDRVLLVLPDQLSNILSRELIYTAVTRARSRIDIWGADEVFCRAVERCVTRRSGLVDRLIKG